MVAQTKILSKIKHSKLQSFSKKDCVLASKDYHQNQVPRKKIKVSAASTSGINNQPSTTTTKSADYTKSDCLASTSSLVHASPFTESQTFTSFFVDVGMYNNDDSMPGCSTSSKQDSFSYQKSPSPSSSDSCSSSVPASTSTSQMKITNFLPVKKHAKPKKMKFGKATSMGSKKPVKKLLKPIGNLTSTVNTISNLNPLSLNNVNTTATDELVLSVDDTTVLTGSTSVNLVGNRSSKLLKKKKRTLKTEVKRKKIRGKPLLH